jgi:hypothetical protein
MIQKSVRQIAQLSLLVLTILYLELEKYTFRAEKCVSTIKLWCLVLYLCKLKWIETVEIIISKIAAITRKIPMTYESEISL